MHVKWNHSSQAQATTGHNREAPRIQLLLLRCCPGADQEEQRQPVIVLPQRKGHHIIRAAAVPYSYTAHYLATPSHSSTLMGFSRSIYGTGRGEEGGWAGDRGC